MFCEKYIILRFFSELCTLGMKYPGRRGYGVGCSHLIEDLIERNKTFIDKILYDEGDKFNEYRINGAGLKIHWKVVRRDKNKNPTFQCYISGDQIRDYPDFVVHAKELIRKWGCNHR